MYRLICILLLISSFASAQNDFLLESYDRPIIEVTVNTKTIYMLVDTGSSLNILDIEMLDKLGAEKRFKMNRVVTLGAEHDMWHIRKVDIFVKGRRTTQFIASDIKLIRESILQATGIKIAGILGTPAIKELGMVIDLRRGIVTLKPE